MTEKIEAGELSVERLAEKHKDILAGFMTKETELKKFLIEDALNNQKQKFSVTFLWFYENNLIGYVALLNDRINLEGNLKELFRGNDVHYKYLPALKIGRLCVHDDFQRRGVGKLMVLFAVQQANEISEHKSGCRFITADAKRNENRELDSIHFYKKLGFKTLKERIKGTTPIYLDLKLP